MFAMVLGLVSVRCAIHSQRVSAPCRLRSEQLSEFAYLLVTKLRYVALLLPEICFMMMVARWLEEPFALNLVLGATFVDCTRALYVAKLVR